MASFSGVSKRFDGFIENLSLTSVQIADGEKKNLGVRSCLNQHFYNSSSETANSMLIGSWGKFTRVRPPRDIDVLFVLPSTVYDRYQLRPGNKQSQLLQEVKSVLQKTYSGTDMSADGQIILVPFASYAVEVAPAFKLTTGKYWICDTNNGGSYKKIDPEAEKTNISNSNKATNGNTRHLIRMMKRWQYYCNVPIKSFWFELLAVDFLSQWEHAGKSKLYYDWMVRDFLKWLCQKANHSIFVPGTYEIINIGDSWLSRAETAYKRAKEACENEEGDYLYLAGEEWQKIFGDFIPTG